MPDDLDTELIRVGLWTVFAAASLARPWATGEGLDDALRPLTPTTRATRDADALLAAACKRWPDIAERVVT